MGRSHNHASLRGWPKIQGKKCFGLDVLQTEGTKLETLRVILSSFFPKMKIYNRQGPLRELFIVFSTTESESGPSNTTESESWPSSEASRDISTRSKSESSTAFSTNKKNRLSNRWQPTNNVQLGQPAATTLTADCHGRDSRLSVSWQPWLSRF
nr:hypothetical protein Iba_chr07bCG7350 [Ipomoea batatas]